MKCVMIIPKCGLFFFLSLVTLKSGVSDKHCVEIAVCESLLWLSSIKDPGIFGEKKEPFKCGDVGSSLVNCPAIQDVDHSNVTLETNCPSGNYTCTDVAG